MTEEAKDTSEPESKRAPHKAFIGAAISIVVLVVGIGIATTSTTQDSNSSSSATSISSNASTKTSSNSVSALSSTAASSASATSTADRSDTVESQSPDLNTQAAPSETSSTPTGGGNTAPATQPTHEHSWEPITAEVQVGEEPIYDTIGVAVFNDGYVAYNMDEVTAHFMEAGRGANLNYHSEQQQIQVGTQPIFETQVVGYRCSGCGEQK